MNLNKRQRVKELDALRGLAALSVVFFHFTLNRPQYNQVFKLGTTGVDLFFVISGFVIFMTLQRVSKGIDFVINRVTRLYPTYWASMVFSFIIIAIYTIYNGTFQVKYALFKFAANLTMFQFYLKVPNLEAPYWTLIIEMIFYISMLLLFELKLLKYLNWIGVVLCSITVLAIQYFYDVKLVKEIFTRIPLFQFLPLFFAGTVFYKIYSGNKNLLLNYLIIIFCLTCQLFLFPHAGRSMEFISWSQYYYMLTLYFIIFILFVNNKLLFIVNKGTLFFGKISYALYLIHQFLSLNYIIPFFYNQLGINFWIVCIFIDLPIIVGIATFITYKIELPYTNQMKEKLRTQTRVLVRRWGLNHR